MLGSAHSFEWRHYVGLEKEKLTERFQGIDMDVHSPCGELAIIAKIAQIPPN